MKVHSELAGFLTPGLNKLFERRQLTLFEASVAVDVDRGFAILRLVVAKDFGHFRNRVRALAPRVAEFRFETDHAPGLTDFLEIHSWHQVADLRLEAVDHVATKVRSQCAAVALEFDVVASGDMTVLIDDHVDPYVMDVQLRIAISARAMKELDDRSIDGGLIAVLHQKLTGLRIVLVLAGSRIDDGLRAAADNPTVIEGVLQHGIICFVQRGLDSFNQLQGIFVVRVPLKLRHGESPQRRYVLRRGGHVVEAGAAVRVNWLTSNR
ncbi:hypothetical protein D9M69_481220 [compost metagenome]